MTGLVAPQAGTAAPWRPTAGLHGLIRRVAAGEVSPLAAASELDAAPSAADLTPSGWPMIAARFAASLAGDMGEDLAEVRARAILAAVAREGRPSSPEMLAQRVDALCVEEADAFAELIGAFVVALAEAARARNCGEILFLARDAIPLHVVADVLARRGLALPRLRLIDINRSMLPCFPDRLAPASEAARRLLAHVQRGRTGAGPALLVDTGVYGTLASALEEIGAFSGDAVFFLFSKHPRRPGFLNHVAGAVPREAARAIQIEALCDTIECWPKPYGRSRLQGDAQAPFAAACLADPVSVLASLSLCARLGRWAADAPLDGLDPAAALDRLARRATPFMLSAPLPVWEHADAWLAREDGAAIAAG